MAPVERKYVIWARDVGEQILCAWLHSFTLGAFLSAISMVAIARMNNRISRQKFRQGQDSEKGRLE